MQEATTVSIIGFFVIVIVLGFLLHLGLSKTALYSKKVRAKGLLPTFIYICVFLVALYILLLIIFGLIHLIGF
ncbi:hypothetical protein ACFO3O_16310 [Dokdonia ponticola]|uniref:Uncharacterized protein n=1 Tax=Dokdonia ponticola TaxID=2041041 RepID=A0ABV9HZG4_9FLAO